MHYAPDEQELELELVNAAFRVPATQHPAVITTFDERFDFYGPGTRPRRSCLNGV
jgi:hypothetical protein